MKLMLATVQRHRQSVTLDALYKVEGVQGIAVQEIHSLSCHCSQGGTDINTQIEFMIPDGVVEPAVAVLQKDSTYP